MARGRCVGEPGIVHSAGPVISKSQTAKSAIIFPNLPANAARKVAPFSIRSLGRTNDIKNPRPALAERPGISCSTEGCGSLVIVRRVTHRNDRSVPSCLHVIPIDLAPLISRSRTGKVVLLVIDLIASVPVVLLNLCACLPFAVLLVGVVVGMILGQGGHACQSHSQDWECECCSNRFHEYSWEIGFPLGGKRCSGDIGRGLQPAEIAQVTRVWETNVCHGLSVFEESDEFRGDVPERIKDGGGVARQQSVRIGTPDAHSAYNIASRRQKLPRFQSPL